MIRMTPAEVHKSWPDEVVTPKAKRSGKRGPNKWEREFAHVLEFRKRAGEIIWYGFESIRLRLADDTYFKADFFAVRSDYRIEVIEVKGFLRAAARVRYNVARDLYPWMDFKMVRKVNGRWEEIQ